MTKQNETFSHEVVASLMTSHFVDVLATITVAEAMKQYRAQNAEIDKDVHNIYVVDETHKLVGMLSLSVMVGAEPEKKVGDLLSKEPPISAVIDESTHDVAGRMQQLNVVELPVVDKQGRLVGVIPSDLAMEAIREEVTDEIFDRVGIVDMKREVNRSKAMVTGSFWHVAGVRIPYLLVSLAGGMLAGAVIGVFEETLEAVVATAIFIPVIMDMGGNAGTQSSTIFTRALVLGQINLAQFVKAWLRECRNGFGMASVLGLVGGLTAHVWQGVPGLGLAVGVSLTLTVTIACGIGFLIPYALIRLGFDQAAGSDPFITTIKDMSGLAIYFATVAWLVTGIVS